MIENFPKIHFERMLAFLGFLLLCVASSAPVDHPDRVINLPGAPELHSQLYSGYLQVAENETRHNVFYVLAEAIRINPKEAPLIVWMNGGPGASSLIGLFMEHGPYLIDPTNGDLRYNDFSWNQYANVLYIETPSGVGFSYSTENSRGFTDDNSTAWLNMKALEDFMTRVHPQYSTRDFYLAGESYAGVYIPYLTREILSNTKSGQFTNNNFKGIAMGNAGVDDFSNRIAAAIQLYGLGMIPEKDGEMIFKLWNQVTREEQAVDENIDFKIAFGSAFNTLGDSAPYNVPLECTMEEDDAIWHIAKPTISAECQLEGITQTYLNQDDVQIALHVRTEERPVVSWSASTPRLYRRYQQDKDTIHVYREIVDSAEEGFRILFYTGDMDLICPPLQVAFGARRIAHQNNMIDMTSSSAWYYLGDFGGARTSYQTENKRISMDVITVRGSGHMVPLSQPDRAFQVINNFISAEAFSMVDYSKKIPRK